MATPARLESALKRLASALDQLEAAGGRLARTGAEKADLEAVLALVQDDRGQLALDLDAALSRSRELDRATHDVAQRLGRAGGLLRDLLHAPEGEQG